MKHVGVREFRDRATHFLAGPEPIAIERHGVLVGFYLPVVPDRDAAARALDRLDATVREVLTQSGLTREELAEQLVGDAHER